MRVLALDIGTRTGWAAAMLDAPALPPPILGNESPAREALRHYHHGRWQGPQGNHPRLFSRFETWLSDKIDTFQVTMLVYEAQSAGFGQTQSAAAAEVLFGLSTLCQKAAYDHGIRHAVIHTATMQKHSTGTGRDSGKLRRKARIKSLGLKVDDNTGDAIFVLSCWLDQQRGRMAA